MVIVGEHYHRGCTKRYIGFSQKKTKRYIVAPNFRLCSLKRKLWAVSASVLCSHTKIIRVFFSWMTCVSHECVNLDLNLTRGKKKRKTALWPQIKADSPILSPQPFSIWWNDLWSFGWRGTAAKPHRWRSYCFFPYIMTSEWRNCRYHACTPYQTTLWLHPPILEHWVKVRRPMSITQPVHQKRPYNSLISAAKQEMVNIFSVTPKECSQFGAAR